MWLPNIIPEIFQPSDSHGWMTIHVGSYKASSIYCTVQSKWAI